MPGVHEPQPLFESHGYITFVKKKKKRKEKKKLCVMESRLNKEMLSQMSLHLGQRISLSFACMLILHLGVCKYAIQKYNQSVIPVDSQVCFSYFRCQSTPPCNNTECLSCS